MIVQRAGIPTALLGSAAAVGRGRARGAGDDAKKPQTLRTYQSVSCRFAAWLARVRDGVAEPSVADFTPQAFVAYLDEREQVAWPSTVKKERAALRKLACYLHQLRLIDATVILMVEIPTVTDGAPTRQGLDRPELGARSNRRPSSLDRVGAVARLRGGGGA